ncbi:sugar ABC transporter permease [bacterium]|nr:MAG: sugar ABC transporter permease [bacterium]
MKTNKERTQLGTGLAFLSPWLIGFCLFTLLPVGLSFYYSLCDYSLLQKPYYTGLSNYRELGTDPVFWKALTNTGYYALLSLPASMMISLGIALLLNADIKGQAFYRTIIFLPSLVPTVASAMLWLWLFNARLGLINILLSKIGIPGPPWLASETWALPALALMSVWGVGQTVVIYLAGLQDVPRELIEAAELDGASAWQRLRHVTLPTISPVIFFNLIMAIIGTMQVFAVPYIMTSGGPARATYFFTMYLYDNAFNYLRMGYASAMAWVQLLLIMALTGIAFWSSRRWVYYQGK